MELTDVIDGAEAVLGRTLTTAEVERVGIMLDNGAGWNGILGTLNVSGDRVVELARAARATVDVEVEHVAEGEDSQA
jgi:hypothetical protein